MDPRLAAKTFEKRFAIVIGVVRRFLPSKQEGQLAGLGKFAVVDLEPLDGRVLGGKEIEDIRIESVLSRDDPSDAAASSTPSSPSMTGRRTTQRASTDATRYMMSEGSSGAIFRLFRPLHVEAEFHHVAVLDHVIFAFDAKLASFAGFGF